MEHGSRPKKSLGQNFLTNPGIAPKMIELSGMSGDFGVIEIGPGRGALTKELVRSAKKVVAIEKDGSLIPELKNSFERFENLTVILSDVLEVNLKELIASEFGAMPVAIFGNLPYNITSPIIMKLLEEKLPVEIIVVMVQKEAAKRLSAPEASRESGAITLAVRYYSSPEILFDVSPGSFYPVPRVTSSVMKLTVRKKPPVTPKDEALMFRIIRAAFSQRRKMAVSAICSGIAAEKSKVREAFDLCGIEAMSRAEQLTLADFAALANSLAGSG